MVWVVGREVVDGVGAGLCFLAMMLKRRHGAGERGRGFGKGGL